MYFKSLITIICLTSLSPLAYTKERVALVIGNNNYKNISKLNTPHADATAVAKRLRAFGFKLIRPVRKDSDVQNDLNLRQMLSAKQALFNTAKGAEIVFLYYAGHGASLGKANQAYILPVQVDKPSNKMVDLELLEKQSLSLNSLLKGLTKQAELTIAVFDACREIPALEESRGVLDSLRDTAAPWRGLRRVEKKKGQIVAYAGSKGQLVKDGDRHSPYTTALLNVMDAQATLEIGDFFRRVANKVSKQIQQEPEVIMKGVPLDRYYLKKEIVLKSGLMVSTGKNSSELETISNEPINQKKKRYALTVNTKPRMAKIRILNIKPIYKDGILLEAGQYRIEISKQGYSTKKQWVKIVNKDMVIDINLVKKPYASLLPNTDFSPIYPSFPHGKGITRGIGGACNATDPRCPSGTSFPSFNNYIDSGQGEGVNDERKFFVIQNITTSKKNDEKMYNSIYAKPGDYIYARAYIHNNGTSGDQLTTAKNVKLGIDGFLELGRGGIFQSKSGSSIRINFFISSMNANPKKVADAAFIKSSTSKKIKLEFRNFKGALKTTNNLLIDSKSFFRSGDNIGRILGGNTSSSKYSPFYVQVTFRVLEDIDSSYDVRVEETVNKKKSYVGKEGDILTYKILVSNIPSSTALARKITVVNDYEQSKIKILSKPTFCKDDGSKLTCKSSTKLPPNKGEYYYYTARIKVGATGIINNTSVVTPSPDLDTNPKNDFSSTKVTIKKRGKLE